MEPIIQSLSSAVLAKDQEPRRHYALGVFHEASGNFDAAFESFRRAVDLQPDETEFVTATLNLSLNLGLFVDALATLEVQIKAAERSGKTDVLAKYWGYKGLALWHVGSSDEARRSFDRALELAKQPEVRARMFNDRVPLFNEKGDFAGAEKTLTSAAVLYRCSLGAANKKTITVLNNLNAALVRQGKLRQADSHLEYVKSLFASDEYLRDPYPVLRVQHAVTRSMMLYERGKFLESAQELRTVQRMLAELHLQNSFLYARATLYLGRSLERAGDSAEAVVQLESSLGLNLHLFGSGHVETINNRVFLGSAYLHAQQSEKASIESRQAELFVAGNPQGQYRFIPRLQALRAELAVLGIADSLQNQDGFSIWETACEAQGIQRDGYVDGAECWRRLSTVGSRLGHAKQEHYATQLALAVRRPALTDQELALVWDIPCTKVVD
jgi:tetratricopeptide (TPR) repeat protein